MAMRLVFRPATDRDATAIVALRIAVAEHLTQRHGRGHWSHCATERGVLHDMKISRVITVRRGRALVATMRLGTKKPWAIDLSYFTAVPRALYLHDMAVRPDLQGQGIGRRMIAEAVAAARAWPADALRLDAYDAPAGAGAFYVKCGFKPRGRLVYRKVPLLYYEMLL